MNLFCTISLSVTGVVAALSVVATMLWLLGAPGVEGSYAKGWKIGLFAVVIYPIVWGCLYAWWRIAGDQLAATHASVFLWVGAGALALLAATACVVFYAFRVMARK